MDPVEEPVDAYNARDIDRFIACYAPDVLIEEGLGKELMRVQGAMRAIYGKGYAKNPSVR